MARTVLTEAQEDYLKQILMLEGEVGRVSTQALAERMGVRPASVTEMVRRLAQLGLVEHARYQGARLSDSGRRVALEMVRHHRLLETFLVERLGYSWDQVHDEAERLEHVISERFEARIAEVLGHPSFDPHGSPIPDDKLVMPRSGHLSLLAELPPGTVGVVARLATDETSELAAMDAFGLGLGVEIEIIASDDDSVDVRRGGEICSIPRRLAQRLWLERKDNRT
jgi:DtxR family Mn-dependent transcriptional regulator